MHWLLTLSRADGRVLFPDDLDHAIFLDRLARLNARWQVRLLAFLLEGSQARLLVAGADRAVAQVCRLQQSGWGVWRHHRRDFLCWEPAMRERVGDAAVVLSVADELHREGGLSWPWSSLREALGLRAADWVDWRWLGAQRCPEQHLRKVAPGWCLPVLASPAWRSREPLPWALVEGAMLHGTGRDPRLRRDRLLRNRLAWAGGWSIPRIAERLGVQDRAVARGLLRAPPPDWGRTRVVLQDPRLRPSWLLGVNGRAKAAELEGPCPAMPTCWSVPEG